MKIIYKKRKLFRNSDYIQTNNYLGECSTQYLLSAQNVNRKIAYLPTEGGQISPLSIL